MSNSAPAATVPLNKYLSLSGAGSRRACAEWVKAGRVAVNGETVLAPGHRVISGRDAVTLDGRPVQETAATRYILLNKPLGCITAVTDDRGRKTVMDYVPDRWRDERLFPVGRLDLNTSGVLLLTNDGDLAYRLAHPRFEVDKVYEALVQGEMTVTALKALRRGVEIDPDVVVTGEARLLASGRKESRVESRIHQGKKRQVRRMLKAVGFPVIRLNRPCFAGLTAKDLKPGQARELSSEEVKNLYRLTGLEK